MSDDALAARSRLIGLLGAGISGSFSPALHEGEARALGISLVYRVLDAEVFPALREPWTQTVRRAPEYGYDALNVTVPAKQAVLDAVDELDDDAAAIGAVNVIVYRDGSAIGCNTDCSGFLEGLRVSVPRADLSSVVQVGAGGAGSAIAYALLREGAEVLTVADIELGRAEILAQRMRTSFPAARISAVAVGDVPGLLPQSTGLVNTTPVGMQGHVEGSPVPLESLHGGLWVADAVYLPRETPLISRARELGCATADGGGMIVGQAVDSFRLFANAEADRGRMLARFERLTAQ